MKSSHNGSMSAGQHTRDFLLVAPVEISSRQVQNFKAPQTTDNGRFFSRSSDRAQFLTYNLEPRKRSQVSPVTLTIGAKCSVILEVAELWIAHFGDTAIVAVLCRVNSPVIDTLSGSELEQLEIALTKIGIQASVSELQCPPESVMWVGRNRLLRTDEKVTEGWLSSEVVTSPLDGTPGASINSGWGNGSVLGWDLLDHTERLEVICGLIDAQYLWHQADKLSRSSLNILQSIGPPQARVKSREVRLMQHQMEEEWTNMANHHLAADDLFLNVQGVRRTVAQANLDAWNYNETIERITRRMQDTGNVVSRKSARLDRRYQSTVEMVLFALGLLTFLEIILSAISAAYSGAVPGMPGDEETIGVFAWLRNTSSDVLVLGAFALIFVAAALVITRRKK
ncbi:MAG TPA: hypothetical protein K8V32_07020 [Enteractinococcus helveticum]|uniref:Uncharacterized protein n=1 Tax=Enteractinococcus helveticum TaxID=1837282 RepID=A0A921K906_9MICC|nr:hypothetical protein [Enteractinococcus helveticum]HJF14544.1 hypothetical protein [Enteractinococcus helveticum]